MRGCVFLFCFLCMSHLDEHRGFREQSSSCRSLISFTNQIARTGVTFYNLKKNIPVFFRQSVYLGRKIQESTVLNEPLGSVFLQKDGIKRSVHQPAGFFVASAEVGNRWSTVLHQFKCNNISDDSYWMCRYHSLIKPGLFHSVEALIGMGFVCVSVMSTALTKIKISAHLKNYSLCKHLPVHLLVSHVAF